YVGPFEELLNDDNKAFSNKISLIILNYIKYDDLLLQAKFFTSSALFKHLVVDLIKNDEINKEMDSSKLIAKYGEIKTSLSIEEDLLLKEIDNYEVDKNELVLDDLDDDFIKDCSSYEALELSRIFIEKFNEDFSELNEESYKIVFGDGSDVHFKYFGNLNLSSLTQSSLDAFEEQILTKIKEGKLSDQWWSILAKYESNNSNLSIINTLKNIRDEFFTSSLNLDIQTANELLPYFIKYKLVEDNSDVFRKIIKNEFLIDEKFCAILKSNVEHIKSLYQKAHKDEKDGFRHTINEKREDLAFLEELAKLIGIRRSND